MFGQRFLYLVSFKGGEVLVWSVEGRGCVVGGMAFFFREAIGCVWTPCCYDILSYRILDRSGFLVFTLKKIQNLLFHLFPLLLRLSQKHSSWCFTLTRIQAKAGLMLRLIGKFGGAFKVKRSL